MKLLSLEEIAIVTGGQDGGYETKESTETNSQAVSKNAETAVQTCGAGNVKSVSTEGFECKD